MVEPLVVISGMRGLPCGAGLLDRLGERAGHERCTDPAAGGNSPDAGIKPEPSPEGDTRKERPPKRATKRGRPLRDDPRASLH